jgi:hypothetical protein
MNPILHDESGGIQWPGIIDRLKYKLFQFPGNTPIDVNHFSGFQFQFVNRDTVNSVTLGIIKIILYNEP